MVLTHHVSLRQTFEDVTNALAEEFLFGGRKVFFAEALLHCVHERRLHVLQRHTTTNHNTLTYHTTGNHAALAQNK